MAKENLTASRIASFACPPDKSQAFLWDTGSPGLGLRVTANGSKAYIFQAKIRDIGEPRITIGDPVTWKLSDARERAREYKLLADKGIDPRADDAQKRDAAKAKRDEQQRVESKRTLLARTAWNAYMEAPHPNWGETHRADHVIAASEGGDACKIGKRESKPGPLAKLLALPLHEITSPVVADWIRTESETRATSTLNAYRKFRTFINWCAENPAYSGIAHAGCCSTREVRDSLPKSKAKNSDTMQIEQLEPWFAAIKKMANPVIGAYCQALVLTGARRNEMAELKWADVDFKWGAMTLRDKVEDVRTIPLPPYLASVLQALPRENEWVFSSPRSKTGHIVSPNKAHAKAVSGCGLPHVSVHGLRRTFKNAAEWVRPVPGVIAQIMGHKPSATAEKHYTYRSLDFLRVWHVKIEGYILKQAKVTWKKSN